MKRLILLLVVLILTGCGTSVAPEIREQAASIAMKCEKYEPDARQVRNAIAEKIEEFPAETQQKLIVIDREVLPELVAGCRIAKAIAFEDSRESLDNAKRMIGAAMWGMFEIAIQAKQAGLF